MAMKIAGLMMLDKNESGLLTATSTDY